MDGSNLEEDSNNSPPEPDPFHVDDVDNIDHVADLDTDEDGNEDDGNEDDNEDDEDGNEDDGNEYGNDDDEDGNEDDGNEYGNEDGNEDDEDGNEDDEDGNEDDEAPPPPPPGMPGDVPAVVYEGAPHLEYRIMHGGMALNIDSLDETVDTTYELDNLLRHVLETNNDIVDIGINVLNLRELPVYLSTIHRLPDEPAISISVGQIYDDTATEYIHHTFTIPDEIWTHPNLSTLNVMYLPLSYVPDTISQRTELNAIHLNVELAHTRVLNLPDDLGGASFIIRHSNQANVDASTANMAAHIESNRVEVRLDAIAGYLHPFTPEDEDDHGDDHGDGDDHEYDHDDEYDGEEGIIRETYENAPHLRYTIFDYQDIEIVSLDETVDTTDELDILLRHLNDTIDNLRINTYSIYIQNIRTIPLSISNQNNLYIHVGNQSYTLPYLTETFTIPNEIWFERNIDTINIHGLPLTTLPENIHESSVQHITLYDTQVFNLPENIGSIRFNIRYRSHDDVRRITTNMGDRLPNTDITIYQYAPPTGNDTSHEDSETNEDDEPNDDEDNEANDDEDNYWNIYSETPHLKYNIADSILNISSVDETVDTTDEADNLIRYVAETTPDISDYKLNVRHLRTLPAYFSQISPDHVPFTIHVGNTMIEDPDLPSSTQYLTETFTIPDEVWLHPKLTKLTVDSLPLDTVPQNIHEAYLTHISLLNTRVITLPENIGDIHFVIKHHDEATTNTIIENVEAHIEAERVEVKHTPLLTTLDTFNLRTGFKNDIYGDVRTRSNYGNYTTEFAIIRPYPYEPIDRPDYIGFEDIPHLKYKLTGEESAEQNTYTFIHIVDTEYPPTTDKTELLDTLITRLHEQFEASPREVNITGTLHIDIGNISTVPARIFAENYNEIKIGRDGQDKIAASFELPEEVFEFQGDLTIYSMPIHTFNITDDSRLQAITFHNTDIINTDLEMVIVVYTYKDYYEKLTNEDIETLFDNQDTSIIYRDINKSFIFDEVEYNDVPAAELSFPKKAVYKIKLGEFNFIYRQQIAYNEITLTIEGNEAAIPALVEYIRSNPVLFATTHMKLSITGDVINPIIFDILENVEDLEYTAKTLPPELFKSKLEYIRLYNITDTYALPETVTNSASLKRLHIYNSNIIRVSFEVETMPDMKLFIETNNLVIAFTEELEDFLHNTYLICRGELITEPKYIGSNDKQAISMYNRILVDYTDEEYHKYMGYHLIHSMRDSDDTHDIRIYQKDKHVSIHGSGNLTNVIEWIATNHVDTTVLTLYKCVIEHLPMNITTLTNIHTMNFIMCGCVSMTESRVEMPALTTIIFIAQLNFPTNLPTSIEYIYMHNPSDIMDITQFTSENILEIINLRQLEIHTTAALLDNIRYILTILSAHKPININGTIHQIELPEANYDIQTIEGDEVGEHYIYNADYKYCVIMDKDMDKPDRQLAQIIDDIADRPLNHLCIIGFKFSVMPPNIARLNSSNVENLTITCLDTLIYKFPNVDIETLRIIMPNVVDNYMGIVNTIDMPVIYYNDIAKLGDNITTLGYRIEENIRDDRTIMFSYPGRLSRDIALKITEPDDIEFLTSKPPYNRAVELITNSHVGIHKFSQLKHLTMTSTEISSEVFNLSIETLNIENVESIPDSIASMKSLKTLHVRNLRALPSTSIIELPNLIKIRAVEHTDVPVLEPWLLMDTTHKYFVGNTEYRMENILSLNQKIQTILTTRYTESPLKLTQYNGNLAIPTHTYEYYMDNMDMDLFKTIIHVANSESITPEVIQHMKENIGTFPLERMPEKTRMIMEEYPEMRRTITQAMIKNIVRTQNSYIAYYMYARFIPGIHLNISLRSFVAMATPRILMSISQQEYNTICKLLGVPIQTHEDDKLRLLWIFATYLDNRRYLKQFKAEYAATPHNFFGTEGGDDANMKREKILNNIKRYKYEGPYDIQTLIDLFNEISILKIHYILNSKTYNPYNNLDGVEIADDVRPLITELFNTYNPNIILYMWFGDIILPTYIRSSTSEETPIMITEDGGVLINPAIFRPNMIFIK
jgi:hypothetical protein